MSTYLGFSTVGANKPKTTNAPAGNDGGVGGIRRSVTTGKKFKLVDAALVVQDFVNAMNIRQGEKVGQPGYGTTVWSFIFEPNTIDVQQRLQTEVRRVASLDPRLILNYVKAFPQEHGILVEVEVAVAPFNQAEILAIFFDPALNTAILQ